MNSTQPSQGFTLTEVLVTIFLIGIIVVAVLSLMTQAFSLNQKADDKGQAILLAQQELDLLKHVSPTSLKATGDDQRDVTFNGRAFQVRRTYCATPAYCTSDQRSVRIDVLRNTQLLFTGETVLAELRVKQ